MVEHLKHGSGRGPGQAVVERGAEVEKPQTAAVNPKQLEPTVAGKLVPNGGPHHRNHSTAQTQAVSDGRGDFFGKGFNSSWRS